MERNHKLPLYSIGATAMITILLALINIGSTQAFNAMVSLSVAGFLGSYILPVVLLLWKRLRTPAHEMQYGPWKLGKFGVIINIAALIWTIIALFFSFWPGTINPTLQNMNWSCLLYGAVNIFGVFFYIVHGRFQYKGPVIETSIVEHLHGA